SSFYTLSLHDALPIYRLGERDRFHSRHRADSPKNLAVIIGALRPGIVTRGRKREHHAEGVVDLDPGIHTRDRGETSPDQPGANRSEEHTSELQSRGHL